MLPAAPRRVTKMARTAVSRELAAAEEACTKLGYSVAYKRVEMPQATGWIAFGVPNEFAGGTVPDEYGGTRLGAARNLAYVLRRVEADRTPHVVTR
jgi:hypothetical protein